MPELNIRVEIPVTRRMIRGAMAALLLGAPAGELSSESVTLTTYYPAPSGVYQQLITTQNVIFARDVQAVPPAAAANTPSFLVLGSTITPTSGTKLAIMGGPVGIKTMSPSPVVRLQVNGAGGGAVDFAVNGRIQLSDPTNQSGICISSGTNLCVMKFGQVASNDNVPRNTTTLGIYSGPAGVATAWRLTMNNSGNVGIGIDPIDPTRPIDPKTTLDVNGQVGLAAACTSTPYAGSTTVNCPANQYASYLQGLYTYYQAGGDASLNLSGNMYCCPCPGGVCPL